MTRLVRVIGMAQGGRSPHDGRYVVHWNPHTAFGTCEIETTSDRKQARRFADAEQALTEWKTVSLVEPVRPDGKANRPLTGLSIEVTS